jgi:hypothetical protein
MEDLNHLTDTLKQYYPIMVDMQASKYVGINLEWNYEEGHVTLSGSRPRPCKSVTLANTCVASKLALRATAGLLLGIN